TSITGTAISGATQISTGNTYLTTNNKPAQLVAYRASGTGVSAGTVIVTPTSTKVRGIAISVLQLANNNTASPIAQSNVSGQGASGNATATLTTPSACNGEVFVASSVNESATWNQPPGFTLGHNISTGESNPQGISILTAWNSVAQTSATATPNPNTLPWGTIALEIAHP